MLDTDDGAEFKGPFEEYLKDHNIEHSIADARNKNALGALDHAVRELRKADPGEVAGGRGQNKLGRIRGAGGPCLQ